MTIRNSLIRQLGNSAYGGEIWNINGDYNVFDLRNSATMAGSSYSKLTDYQKAGNREWHSTAADLELANPAELDFHPKSVMGRYDAMAGNWATDTVQSAAIDFGDPAAAYTNEPYPNGGRINIGNYGNTSEASKSRTNAWLRALTYNEGGVLSGTNNALYWVGGGFASDDTVRLEYSKDFGNSWTLIAAGIAATNGVYMWDVTGLIPCVAYWRIVNGSNTNVWDRNDQRISVNGAIVEYYVNDGSVNGDVYCTAAGNDANTGMTPDRPMATVNELLAKYALGGGNIIYLDTGVYSNQIYVTGNDSGSGESGWMTIQGSTNMAAGGTVVTASGGNALYLNGVVNVRARALRLRNSVRGVYIYNSSGIELEDVWAYNNSEYGYLVESSYATMRGCVAAWNGSYGLYAYYHSTIWENGVLWENGSGVLAHYPMTIRNSLIRQLGNSAYGGEIWNINGDYNVFDLRNSATMAGSSYSKLTDYQKAGNREWHSTAADLELANPAELDFHPKSVMGRYDAMAGNWATDTVQSAAIDFGDPAAAYTNEPTPNGGRINIGNYGNTSEASKSRTNAWLRALTYNEGGVLSGTNNALYWVGGGFASDDTVRLEYSKDFGNSWTLIAAGIAATNGVYMWDVTGLIPCVAYWRIVNGSNTNVWDRNDQRISVNGAIVEYYVNDGSVNGDVYCTAAGNDANTGHDARPSDGDGERVAGEVRAGRRKYHLPGYGGLFEPDLCDGKRQRVGGEWVDDDPGEHEHGGRGNGGDGE